MLNRIRRAVSLTRARYSAEGRHRRPLTPVRPPTASAFPATADALTVELDWASTDADRRHSLVGEDIALVRPYVLAWEKRVRTRSVIVVPHLPISAWSALAGVH
ncbi:hypothetical protein [Streptomyces sp. NPDC048643]|uniref:hypothetical protein n=1 Tax=Streptomyces sp. NPDC048643 TaxID=3155637 RepID=UPI00343BCEE0